MIGNKKIRRVSDDLKCAITNQLFQVYGDLSPAKLEHGVIVSPTNDVVRDLNSVILDRLPGRERNFLCQTKMIIEDRERGAENVVSDFVITQEELDNVCASNIPPANLRLKVGSVVMLLMNLNKKQGLCNGMRFVVTQILQDTIKVRRLVPFKGECDEVFLPKLLMKSDDVPVAGSIERRQFPVSLAFVITINKSQGQTFEHVGMYLQRPVFTHGQFFVGVSRGKTKENVWVAVVKGPSQGPIGQLRGGHTGLRNTATQNIVYRNMLL